MAPRDSTNNNRTGGNSEIESLARDIYIQMASDPVRMQGYQTSVFASRAFELAEGWIKHRNNLRDVQEVAAQIAGGTPASNSTRRETPLLVGTPANS